MVETFEVGQKVLFLGHRGRFEPVHAIIICIGRHEDKLIHALDNGHWGYETEITSIL